MSCLLLTLGDPNGLGPELLCHLFTEERSRQDSVFRHMPVVCTGPEQALLYHARRLHKEPFWTRVSRDFFENIPAKGTGELFLYVPAELEKYQMQPGQARISGGHAAGLSLEAACDILASRQAAAVVTCPLNKAMLQDAGFAFAGHTEFFARYFAVPQDKVCMHLCGPLPQKGAVAHSKPVLRVSLVTTHPPLTQVPGLITQERILHCIRLTTDLMHVLGTDNTPVAVCGLNPHAGESGHIGHEDKDIITPAIEQARGLGLNVTGPVPGDTVFHFAAAGHYSAVLAMYHDQGLAPLKLLHFGQAVNITLGLPIIRTSVDHGTGYELVGKDTADSGSLKTAMQYAHRLVRTV